MAIVSGKDHSSKSKRPPKPYDSFPLTPHACGKWCKQICGKLYYFGKWDDWESALKEFEHAERYIRTGRNVPPHNGSLTLEDLCNLFLEAKDELVENGELSRQTFIDYRKTCRTVVDLLGRKTQPIQLGPDDFRILRSKLSKRMNPNSLANEITRVKVLFNWAIENEYLEKVSYGNQFKKPTARVRRRHKNEKRLVNGRQMFEPSEIQLLLRHAKPQMRAMILLAANCGLGNHDCGQLQVSHLDLEEGWLDFPRPKTHILRKARLWPETMAAVTEVIKNRPNAKTKSAQPLVFRTKYGNPWTRETGTSTAISSEMKKLMEQCGIESRGRNFYALHHGFETIAGGTKDQVCVDVCMGRVDGSVRGVYREDIDDSRFEAVADHVHHWLFGEIRQ